MLHSKLLASVMSDLENESCEYDGRKLRIRHLELPLLESP